MCECDLVFSSPTAPAKPSVKELSNALDSVVNWHLLGVKLGLEDHELRTIEQNYRGDNERCKHEMLNHLLQNANLPTWKAVAMVTSSPIVNDQYQSISSSTDLPKYAAFYVAYVDCSHQCTSGQGRNICSRDSHHECRGYAVRN